MTDQPFIYPTVFDVNKADLRDLMRWNRTLPSPATGVQQQTMKAIIDRLSEARHDQPRAYIEASKEVGW